MPVLNGPVSVLSEPMFSGRQSPPCSVSSFRSRRFRAAIAVAFVPPFPV